MEGINKQIRQDQRPERVLYFQITRPKDITRHNAAVEKHSEENQECDDVPAFQLFSGKRVGQRYRKEQTRQCPDSRRHDREAVGLQDRVRIAENVLISVKAECLGPELVTVADQGGFRGNRRH